MSEMDPPYDPPYEPWEDAYVNDMIDKIRFPYSPTNDNMPSIYNVKHIEARVQMKANAMAAKGETVDGSLWARLQMQEIARNRRMMQKYMRVQTRLFEEYKRIEEEKARAEELARREREEAEAREKKRKHLEAVRRREEERRRAREAQRQAELEAARERAAAIEREAAREREELEAARLREELEAARQQEELEAARQREELEAARQREELEAARQQEEFEATRQREAQAAREREEVEAARQRELIAARQREELDAARQREKHRRATEAQEAHRMKDEAEKARLAEERNKKEQAAIAAGHVVSNFMPLEAIDQANARVDRINKIKTDIKPKLGTQPALMQAVFKAKMTITQRVGQVMNNEQKIIEIAKALNGVLTDAKQASDEVYAICMDMLAKRILNQAESEVAVKTSTAFPLAILCVMLYRQHKGFLDILLGRLIKRCPYVVPVYRPKLKTDTDDSFRKKIGYRKLDDEWETEAQYTERMCGILALYAAIVQTKTIPNDYGIENGWNWLARILNNKPRRITPLLILKFLEVAGHELLKTFGKQAVKLLQFLADQYIAMIPSQSVATTTRLQIFLEPLFKSGQIPEPEGRNLEK